MQLHYYLTSRKLFNLAGTLWRMHGIKAPFVLIARFALYGWCLLFRARKTFALDGKNYRYAINLQNGIFRNERAVEIPIVLQMFPLDGNILEVGNVLSQYMEFPHDVVDKYEKNEGVQNVDIVDYVSEKQYDFIVSISTLEHVGWDESPKDPGKLLRAITSMKALLKPGGRMLVTVPLGYNDFLDRCIESDSLGFSKCMYMKRTSYFNDWVQATREDSLPMRYGSVYPCANAIAVGVYECE